MGHHLFDGNRIDAGLTPEQYHQVLTEQADALVEFTPLNLQRTNRILKTYRVTGELVQLLNSIQTPQTWMVLTEPWCGDSAQCLPYITVMAALNKGIDLRLFLRDENLDIMDEFLTQGKRSIPRLVIFDQDGQVLTQWGPRPALAQEVFNQAKIDGLEKPALLEKLHLFYGRNRGAALEKEFIHLLNEMLAR